MKKSHDQISPEALMKSLECAVMKGQSAESWLTGMMEDSDIVSRIMKEVSDKLFDKENLLMIMRSSEEIAYYVLKHLIIKGFYAEYYYRIRYYCVLVGKDAPTPSAVEFAAASKKADIIRVHCECYDKLCWYETPPWEDTTKKYGTFISELEQITVSFNGEGRKELVDMFRSLTDRRMGESQSPGGLMKWLGLAR